MDKIFKKNSLDQRCQEDILSFSMLNKGPNLLKPFSNALLLLGFGFLLIYISFPNLYFHLSVAAWFCFVPLMVFLDRMDSFNKKIFFSYLFLQLFFLVMFYFKKDSVPASLHLEDHKNGITWFIIVMPLLYSLPLSLGSFITKKELFWTSLAISGGLWISLEYFVIGKWLGFPLSLALTNFNQPYVIQLASIGGIISVSTVLFLTNRAVATIFQLNYGLWIRDDFWNKIKKIRHYLLYLALIISLLLWGIFRVETYQKKNKNSYCIAIVQPNLSWKSMALASLNRYYFKWVIDNVMDMALEAREKTKPDLIVFPEGIFIREIFSKEFYYPFKSFAKRLNLPFIVYTKYKETSTTKVYSTACFFRGEQFIQMNKKVKLVPIFESDISSMTGITQQVFLNTMPGLDIGSMICFEVLFSDISNSLTQKGANVLLCISNNAYFGKSNWALLHAAYSVFRAVEYSRTFVFANNAGFSIVSNPVGHIEHISPYLQRRVSKVTITISESETFFYKHPSTFLIAMLSLSLLSCLFRFYCFFYKRRPITISI